MLAQPSGSWKLRAMSVPFCSVHTIRVSAPSQLPLARLGRVRHTLLFLVAVVFGDARLEQLSRLVVFGKHYDFRLLGLQSHKSAEHGATIARNAAIAPSRAMHIHSALQRGTYTQDHALAKARAPVEPVIVLELVYLDALAIVGRWRYQCHSRGEGLGALRPGPTRPPECSARSRCSAWAGGQMAAGVGAAVKAQTGCCALADDDRTG